MTTPRRLTFIYTYLASAAEGDELLYSVRSVARYFEGIADIWIIGDLPQWWHRRDRFISAPKIYGGPRLDAANKMYVLSKHARVPEEFVWMMDDIYFLRPISYDFLNTPWTHSEGRTASSLQNWFPAAAYVRQKKRTWMALAEKGRPLEDYASHMPRIYRKECISQLFKTYPLRHVPLVADLLYCNEFYDVTAATRLTTELCRFGGKPTDADVRNRVQTASILNNMNGAFSGAIARFLKVRLGEPCVWEKQ